MSKNRQVSRGEVTLRQGYESSVDSENRGFETANRFVEHSKAQTQPSPHEQSWLLRV